MSDPGYRGVQEVEYGASSQKLTCWADVSGVQDNPAASAVVSVYRPGQTDDDPEIDGAAATEDATTHQLSYLLNATDTSIWALGPGNRAKWSWTDSGGIARTATITFEVVRQPLIYNCPVTYEDLQHNNPSITEAMTQLGETATTVAQKYIMPGWADVLQWVRSKGRRPALTTGKEGLERVAYYRILILLLRGLREAGGSVSQQQILDAMEDHKRAETECVLEYRDGDVSAPVTERTWQQPQLLVGNDLRTGAFGSLTRGWRP